MSRHDEAKKEAISEIELAIATIQEIRDRLCERLRELYPVGQAEPAGLRDEIAELAGVQEQLKAAAFDLVVARRGKDCECESGQLEIPDEPGPWTVNPVGESPAQFAHRVHETLGNLDVKIDARIEAKFYALLNRYVCQEALKCGSK